MILSGGGVAHVSHLSAHHRVTQMPSAGTPSPRIWPLILSLRSGV